MFNKHRCTCFAYAAKQNFYWIFFSKLYGIAYIVIAVKGALTLEDKVDSVKTEHKFLVISDSKINNEGIVGYDVIQKF